MVETQLVETKPVEWLQVKTFHGRYPEAGSINFIYQMAKTGELLSIKLAGRVLIRSDALDRLLEQQKEGAGPTKDTAPETPDSPFSRGADVETS